MELFTESCRDDGDGHSGRRGRGGQVVGRRDGAGVGRGGGFAGSVTGFTLHEEAQLVHIPCQVEDQSKEVVPAEFKHTNINRESVQIVSFNLRVSPERWLNFKKTNAENYNPLNCFNKLSLSFPV